MHKHSTRSSISRRDKRMRSALVAIAVLVPAYFFWIIKSEAPVIIHVLIIFMILSGGLEVAGWFWTKHSGQSCDAQHCQSASSNRSTTPTKNVSDSVLGIMEQHAADDNHWWETSIRHGQRNVVVKIAGDEFPVEAIVSEVKSLAVKVDRFVLEVQKFLIQEADNDPNNKEDIMGLRIESIHFLWANKPRYAELYFGSSDGRVWSCGYESGRLYNLSVSG